MGPLTKFDRLLRHTSSLMAPNHDQFRRFVNRALLGMGMTPCLQSQFRTTPSGYTQFAFVSRDEEKAFEALDAHRVLASDFKWTPTRPFLFAGRSITLVDFDERHSKPWTAVDGDGNVFRLSTKEVAAFAIESTAIQLPRNEFGHFVKPVETRDAEDVARDYATFA